MKKNIFQVALKALGAELSHLMILGVVFVSLLASASWLEYFSTRTDQSIEVDTSAPSRSARLSFVAIPGASSNVNPRTLRVILDTAGQPIQSADVAISFPDNLVTISDVNTRDSVCTQTEAATVTPGKIRISCLALDTASGRQLLEIGRITVAVKNEDTSAPTLSFLSDETKIVSASTRAVVRSYERYVMSTKTIPQKAAFPLAIGFVSGSCIDQSTVQISWKRPITGSSPINYSWQILPDGETVSGSSVTGSANFPMLGNNRYRFTATETSGGKTNQLILASCP